MEINRISEFEIEVADPQTGGVWRIVAPHELSEAGALLAIEQVLREQKIQPARGATITVEYQLKIQEDGEDCHPLFDDILTRVQQALNERYGRQK